MRFGMRLMRYAEIYPQDYLADCVLRMLRANELRENVHIRVIAYLGGDDELAQTGPVGLIAGALPRGSPKGVSEGIHVRVGSWARLADNALPPRVKCTGNYVNNRAAGIEAKQDGYDGVVVLTAAGKVSEGWGACLFIARHGRLHTPDLASDILERSSGSRRRPSAARWSNVSCSMQAQHCWPYSAPLSSRNARPAARCLRTSRLFGGWEARMTKWLQEIIGALVTVLATGAAKPGEAENVLRWASGTEAEVMRPTTRQITSIQRSIT